MQILELKIQLELRHTMDGFNNNLDTFEWRIKELEQGSVNVVCKEPDSNFCRVYSLYSLVTPVQVCGDRKSVV